MELDEKIRVREFEFILTLVGGIIIIVQGGTMAGLGSFIISPFMYIGIGASLSGFGVLAMLGLGAITLVLGILIIMGAVMIRKRNYSTGGVIAVVGAVVSMFLGGGFVIGFIISLIGGILALKKC